MTAAELVNEALKHLGVKSVSAAESALALKTLNGILESWTPKYEWRVHNLRFHLMGRQRIVEIQHKMFHVKR